MGSGVDWVVHLNENGIDVTTQIISECNSKQELNQLGRYYSNFYKITTAVDNYGNRIWANRIPETGGGSCSAETAEKISKKLRGIKKPLRTPEHIEKIASKLRGSLKPRSDSHQQALTASVKQNWKNNDNRRTKTAEVGRANKGRKQTPDTLAKRRQAMLEYWRIKRSHAV